MMACLSSSTYLDHIDLELVLTVDAAAITKMIADSSGIYLIIKKLTTGRRTHLFYYR
jgi:hypothetical protein